MDKYREVRKHIDDLTTTELRVIRQVLNNKKFNFSSHCYESMAKRGIRKSVVSDAIRNGRIIEFHLISKTPRVMLRTFPNRRGMSSYVVVELQKNINQVVTTYPSKANKGNNENKKLKYSDKLDVVKVISKYIK